MHAKRRTAAKTMLQAALADALARLPAPCTTPQVVHVPGLSPGTSTRSRLEGLGP